MKKQQLPVIAAALALSLASPAWGAPPPANSLEALHAANSANQPAKPSLFEKMGASFKQGTDKMAAALKPKSSASRAKTNDPVSLSSKPGKPGIDLYISMAEAAERMGNFAEAEKQYQSALKQSPHDLQVLISYAHALDRQNKFEQATSVYQHALEKHPREAAIYNDLGLCYHRRQMLEDAKTTLSKAVELQPDRKLYRNNLAAVLVDTGGYDEALMQLMMAHGDAVAHYNLGYMLVKKGNSKLALYQFQEAAHADPTMSAAHQWIAKLSPAGQPQAPVAQLQNPPVQPQAPPGKPQVSMGPPQVSMGQPHVPTVQPQAPVVQFQMPPAQRQTPIVQPQMPTAQPQFTTVPPQTPMVQSEPPELVARRIERAPSPTVQLPPTQPEQPPVVLPASPVNRSFKSGATATRNDAIANLPRASARTYPVQFPQPQKEVEVQPVHSTLSTKPASDLQIRGAVVESAPTPTVNQPVARIRVATDSDDESP